MSTWSNAKTATLKVREQGSATSNFTFAGVNPNNDAGSPENFLDAANRLLNIASLSATITGIARTVTQEAIE